MYIMQIYVFLSSHITDINTKCTIGSSKTWWVGENPVSFWSTASIAKVKTRFLPSGIFDITVSLDITISLNIVSLIIIIIESITWLGGVTPGPLVNSNFLIVWTHPGNQNYHTGPPWKIFWIWAKFNIHIYIHVILCYMTYIIIKMSCVSRDV